MIRWSLFTTRVASFARLGMVRDGADVSARNSTGPLRMFMAIAGLSLAGKAVAYLFPTIKKLAYAGSIAIAGAQQGFNLEKARAAE
jgi:hypothetical protein